MSDTNNRWFATELFQDRVALVTGGGSGIGEGIAAMLAAHGCKVIVADLKATPPSGVASIIADVRDAAAVEQAIETIEQDYGRLDYVANCAGTTISGELATLPMSDWHSVLELNLTGPLNVARAAFPLLKRQAGSAMVNIGSIASAGAYPGGGSYAASKAALLVLTRQLAVEWAEVGIRVNSVSPGPTRTPLLDAVQSENTKRARAAKVPLKRIGEPVDLAAAACFLLSPAAAFVTGHELIVDGGLTQTLMNGTAAWVENRASKVDVEEAR